MRTPWTGRLAAVALALSVATATQAGAAPAPEDKDEKSSGADVLTPLLERRLSGKVGVDDVVVDIRWPFEGSYTSTRVSGSGVGIWKREFQIRLPRAEVRKLLKLLVTNRFGSLPQSFGAEEGGEESLKGRILVSIGPVTKLVSQAQDGEQSPALQTIAEQFLRASKKASAHGIGVSSFADGFQKFSAGTLAPEALRLDVRRRVSTVGGEGWLLRTNGRRVYTENLEKVGVPSSARVLVLTPKNFAALAQALRDADPATLPQNLYAPEYTDVLIQLLNKSRHIQARNFSGMTPESKGEKQAAFDRLLTALVALHARVEKEGRIVEIPDQMRAESEERERERGERERERDSGKDDDAPKPSVTPASPGRP